MPPVVAASLPLPGDHGAELDKRERVLPAGPEPSQPDPEEAIGRVEAWYAARRLQPDINLLIVCL